MAFQYFISSKNGLAVVSLKGGLDEKDGPALARCLDEISGHNPSGVVLHLGDLTSLPPAAFREFAAFTKSLKAKGHPLLISSLKAESLKGLLSAGLISRVESRDDLGESVKEMAARIALPKGA